MGLGASMRRAAAGIPGEAGSATSIILGSPGSYYIGVPWTGGSIWRHSSSAAGDMDILTADGGSFTNILYASYTVSGQTITFATVTLTSGLTLITKVTVKRAGVYLIAHTLQSSTNRWAKLSRNLKDSTGGSTVVGTSHATSYNNTTVASTDAQPFIAAAAHHTNGRAATLIAGNGYDNDWCLYSFDYVSQTGWYNQNVVSKQASSINLTYGLLANSSTTDYTVRLQAGIPRDVSYVLCVFTPSSMNTYNQGVYAAYHDAYCPVTGRTNIQKMLWSTAHQLQRLKRHILVEGSKQVIQNVSHTYAPAISIGDIMWQTIGLGDSAITNRNLSLLHSLGSQDGAAAGGSLAGSAGNNLDGTFGVWVPWLELYAKLNAGYVPDATAQAQYLALANSYADTINNVKMVPDSSTQLAHYYSDLFAGPESLGYGDFEQPFTFPEDSETQVRWSSTGGTSTRVGVDGGVTPRSGSWMAKMVGTGAPLTLNMMQIAVPSSKTVTMTTWVNIPSAFGSGGATIQMYEYDSSGTNVASAGGTDVSVTSGWQQVSLSKTLTSTTCYLQLTLAVHSGAGTAYFDDVQCTLASPDYPGILWNCCIMPPQLKGNHITPNAFSMINAQLNLKCLKVLLGASWTTPHETALGNVNNTFPAAFWFNSSHDRIIDDLYHPIRKTWLTSWGLFGHFIWYLCSAGTKIFADSDVANIYAAHPAGSGGRSYGNVMLKGWVMTSGGASISGSDFTSTFLTGWPSTAGYYVNAGGWLWAVDAFAHQVAVWAGVPGAVANKIARLNLEVDPSTPSYHAHESINSITGDTNAAQEGYGSNVLALLT